MRWRIRIVAHFAQGDPRAQCGIEVACVFDRVFVTGRIASSSLRSRTAFLSTRDEIVHDAYASAGYGVDARRSRLGAVAAKPEDRSGRCASADSRKASASCATCPTTRRSASATRCAAPGPNYLPPAHWLARRIGRELVRLRVERGAGQIGPDGKVIVHGTRTGSGGAFRPELVSVSLNHHEQSDWLLLRRVVEEAVETACAGMALPEVEMNGAGMFVAGGPNGDNGLSGKKLVVDAYGPGVPIGGGAWSGKDFFKVDRLGGMAARRLALESLIASDADEALVTLTYLPGGDRPARVDLLLDGLPSDGIVVPGEFGKLESRVLHDIFAPAAEHAVDLARWGHQIPGMPWELPVEAVSKCAAPLEISAAALQSGRATAWG